MRKILLSIWILLTVVCASYAQTTHPFLKKGVTLHEGGKLEAALTAFQKVLVEEPENEMAHFWMGNVYYDQTKMEEAIIAYSLALNLNEQLVDAFIYRGLAQLQTKDFQEAKNDFQAAIELQKESMTYLYLAEACIQLGEPDLGQLYTSEAIIMDADNWEAYALRADLAYAQNQFDLAVADYSKIIDHQASAKQLNRRGNAYLKLNQKTAALQDYQRANQLSPTSAAIAINLVNLQLEIQNSEGLLAVIDRVLNNQPNERALQELRIKVLMDNGDFEGAAAAMKRVEGFDQNDPSFAFSLGMMESKKGNYLAAVEHFTNALNTPENTTEILLARAFVYQKIGDPGKAEYDLSTVLRKDPKNLIALERLGLLFYDLNDPAKAQGYFKRLLDVDARNSNAAFHLSKIYTKKNALDEALFYANKAHRIAPNDAAILLQKATISLELGVNTNQSVVDLERAIRLDPKNPASLDLLGQTYLKLGKMEEAIVIFERIESQEGSKINPQLNLAVAYCKIKEYKTSFDLLQSYISEDRSNPTAYFYQGEIWMVYEKYEKAAASYSEALAIDPAYPNAFYKKALAFYEMSKSTGDHGPAIHLLNRLIKKEPSHHQALFLLGKCHADQRDFNTAVKYFDQAIALDSLKVDYFKSRALANSLMDEIEKALDDYSSAIALDSKDGITFDNRGMMLYKLNLLGEAIQDFSRAIHLNPLDPSPYYHRASAYIDLLEYQKAISDLSTSLGFKENPTINVYEKRGLAYMEQKEFEKAKLDFTTSIEKFPQDVVAYHYRGIANGHLKNYPEAITDFNTVLQRNPNYGKKEDVLTERGKAHYQVDDFNMAINDFSQSLKLSPKNADIYLFRGHAYKKNKDYIRAIADYDESLEWQPQQEDAYFNRGMAKYFMQQFSSASRDFQSTVDLNPNNGLAYYNLANTFVELKKLDLACQSYYMALELNVGSAQNGIRQTCK